jgi:hypothetical protein
VNVSGVEQASMPLSISRAACQDRGMSTREQIAVAQLEGHAMNCIHRARPVGEAVSGLQEITTRPDLLAEAAGVLAGAADPEIGERPWRIAAARLLVAAGADRELLPKYIEQGRRNVSRPAGWGTGRVWPDDLDQVLADVLAE